MQPLSVVIITLNEEHNIRRCIASVREIADEILVVDSHSTDNTAEICRKEGCIVIPRTFDGYGRQKQFAVDQAKNDWILSLDADECVTPELSKEIRSLNPGKDNGVNGYRIPRKLVYLGRVMRFSGTGNEKLLRLFNRRYARFTDVPVHEKVVAEGKTELLRGNLLHYSYKNLAHHFAKTNEYTTRAAEGYAARKKRFPPLWVAGKFPVSFITFYIFKGGILDGYPGFIWSFMAAVYGSMKIAKTIEQTKKETT